MHEKKNPLFGYKEIKLFIRLSYINVLYSV